MTKHWVVDASFCGTLLLPDGGSDASFELVVMARLGAIEFSTPALCWYEMANLLVTATKRGRIKSEQARDAWALIEALPIKTHWEARGIPHWPKLTATAIDYSLSAYDTAYLSLAELLKAGLASGDKDLRKAAKQKGVPLWPQS